MLRCFRRLRPAMNKTNPVIKKRVIVNGLLSASVENIIISPSNIGNAGRHPTPDSVLYTAWQPVQTVYFSGTLVPQNPQFILHPAQLAISICNGCETEIFRKNSSLCRAIKSKGVFPIHFYGIAFKPESAQKNAGHAGVMCRNIDGINQGKIRCPLPDQTSTDII